MRYDDMLATLLAQRTDDAGAREALWTQLVDVLAQGRGEAERQAQGYARLAELRPAASLEAARRAARALAGRDLPPALVELFAGEAPPVAGVVLATVRMEEADWLALLPKVGPTGRGFLRNRRDLGRDVRHALSAFGPADLVLPGSVQPAEDSGSDEPNAVVDASAAGPSGPVRIGDLVARIEAFRASGRGATPEPVMPASGEFRFETDREGIVRWVDGLLRGAIIGATVAHAGGEQGVDAHAAGAFLRRAPFRDARLTIADGVGGGEWRISGVPFFDRGDGRFQGFRGTVRRPRADEVAPRGRTLLGADTPPDTLRQLVHELRTPLNAIVGFAEMIDGQMLGPAADPYRRRAASIADDGRRLLAAIEDLDAAARIEGGRWVSEAGTADVADLLARLLPDYVEVAASRGAALSSSVAPDLPPVPADAIAVERVLARLLGAVTALSAAGETILAELRRGVDATVLFSLTRPTVLAGRDERTLLDPGFAPAGEWPEAPLLGLAFTLRLVRGIVETIAGTLEITPERFLLRLPAEADSARDEGNG